MFGTPLTRQGSTKFSRCVVPAITSVHRDSHPPVYWMGTEPNATPASDLATFQEQLETEAVTFVDTVNDELTALIEDADHLG